MKTVCIYHSIDLDGWMSAAIVKNYQNESEKYPNEVNDFIGYNYGQPIPDLSGYECVIMCDISFPKEEMLKLRSKLSEKFIWIDHHISAIKEFEAPIMFNGLQNTKFAACELTWQYFYPNKSMPELVRLLGRYDCFGHKGTPEERKVLEFQYGARALYYDYNGCYSALVNEIDNRVVNQTERIHDMGIGIYNFLCTEAKQSYKNKFDVVFTENCMSDSVAEGMIKKKRKFAVIDKERFNPINFGIDYHADGYDGAACFHYANGKWNFSLYNDNGLVDCSVIAKQYGGGGHKGASGFVTQNINQFIIQ